MSKNYLFVANPGTHYKGIEVLRNLCKQHLANKGVHYEFKLTEYVDHARELVQQYGEGFDVVVAVGGDGTVNEVAKGLIHSRKALGIIPNGSGNGLARHLGYSMRLEDALLQLIEAKTHQADFGWVNQKPFFNVAGIGFDAHVAKNFQESKKRGLFNYLRISAREFFKYEYPRLIVECDQLNIDCPAVFSITIANGSQLGNNAVVAKAALMNDGLLNVCLIRKYPLWYLPVAIFRLFTKTLHKSRFHHGAMTEEIHVTHVGSDTTLGQIDGEPVLLEGPIEYKIEKSAISILVPKK